MRWIFFALAALTLGAVAALWSEGGDVAAGGAVSAKVGVPEATSARTSEVAGAPEAPASKSLAGDQEEPDAALEDAGAGIVPPPGPPASEAETVVPSGRGSVARVPADEAPPETLQLAERAPFPGEVSSRVAGLPPEDVQAQRSDGAHVASRERAPFDPEWSAALVRRLLALHRTLSE